MRKLRLDLEDIGVESFETVADFTREGGTIHAHEWSARCSQADGCSEQGCGWISGEDCYTWGECPPVDTYGSCPV